MKKILIAILSILFTVSLTACSKDSPADNFKEYISSTSDITENGVIYYSIYLEDSLEWEDIGYSEQSDFAKACVLHCEELAAASNINNTNVNVIAFKQDESNAFSSNGSDVIRLYKEGVYDCDYNIIR